jgi:hypothetical protein
MIQSQRTKLSNININFGINSNRIMWHLVKKPEKSPWGWSSISIKKLNWIDMINLNTNIVVVLGMLGRGADGKVLLVCNKIGQISAMKLLKESNIAQKEAENWNIIYSDLCKLFKWNIRHELWMGENAIIMPLFNQFQTKQERLDNLPKVEDCLRKYFLPKHYIHDDIYWRNIGYYKYCNEIQVILLDLNPGRVQKVENLDDKWIQDKMNYLKERVSIDEKE